MPDMFPQGGAGAPPSLGALSLSTANATAGSAFTATVSGKTPNSSLFLLDGYNPPRYTLSGTTITGTGLSGGTDQIELIETMAGSPNSPRNSPFAITVVGQTLSALTLSTLAGTDGQTYSATISGKTAGSILSVRSLSGKFSLAGTTVSGSDLHADQNGSPKAYIVTLVETLPGALNSGLATDFIVVVSVAGAWPVIIAPTPDITLPTSGDTSGATDTAAINALLATGKKVRISIGTGAVFYINAPMVMYSNSGIITNLADAIEIRLVAGSNCQMVVNANTGSQTQVDQNLILYCPGAYFNGQPNLQVRQSGVGLGRQNQGIVLISVNNFQAYGLKINTNSGAFSNFGVTNFVADTITLAQDGIQNAGVNQDGFDIGPGCSNFYISNVTGKTYDDVVSVYAKAAQSNTSMAYGTPWQAGANIYNMNFKNMQVASHLDNFFRLQAGNTFTCLHGRASNCNNTLTGNPVSSTGDGGRNFVRMGARSYVTTYLGAAGPLGGGIPLPTDLSDWIFDQCGGGSNFGIGLDTNCDNIHFTNWTQTVPLKKLIGTSTSEGNTFTPQVSNITFAGITDTYAGPLIHDTLFGLNPGSTHTGVSVTGASLNTLACIDGDLAGGTNLTLGTVASPISIGTPEAALFAPSVTSTGSCAVAISGSQRPVTYEGQSGLTFTATMPPVGPKDTIPAALAGSTITVANGVDPTGGSAPVGGTYAVSGGAWTLSGSYKSLAAPVATTGTWLSDSFVDTTGTCINSHASAVGGYWDYQTGDGIQASNCLVDTGATAVYANSFASWHASPQAPTPDGSTTAVFIKRTTISTDSLGFTFRASRNSTTYYHVRWNETAQQWQLYKAVAGTFTSLGAAAATFNVGDTHTLVATYVGSSIIVSLDGTNIITVTDTAIPNGGFTGVRFAAGQTAGGGVHIKSVVSVNQ